jgi:integral membrane protein
MNRPEWLMFGQPPVPAQRVADASGHLLRYRIMAFATGVVLSVATVALILKSTGVKHMEPGTGLLWLFHGYLYLMYVITTAILGVRLRWPLPRYALVMAAGTIPTMSFVAEHFVTRAARAAADAPQPAPTT